MQKLRRGASEEFLRAALRAVVRFCIRSGFRIQDVLDCAKAVFIEEAVKELEAHGEKVSISRLNVITGIHRKDISNKMAKESPKATERSLVMKVMGRWQTDKRFVTKRKKPRALSFGPGGSEFRTLVSSVSKELNPASVLFELERVNAVRRKGNRLNLLLDTYVPKADFKSGLELVVADVEELLLATEENLLHEPNIPNLHARTEFDNVRPEAQEEIRSWLVREGHRFHRKARDFLSQFDQDISPDPDFKGEGVRVSLGTFSHIDDGV